MGLLDGLAARLGYVSLTEHLGQLKKLSDAERQLRHALRDLKQQQLLYRLVMEQELAAVREIAADTNQRDIQQSVQRLDAVGEELRSLIIDQFATVDILSDSDLNLPPPATPTTHAGG